MDSVRATVVCVRGRWYPALWVNGSRRVGGSSFRTRAGAWDMARQWARAWNDDAPEFIGTIRLSNV